MPFGRSYAGLDSLSAYRASVAQRMPTRAIRWLDDLCRCSTCSAVVASSPRNMVNSSQSSGATTSFPIVAAIRPAARIVSALQHEPRSHNGPSRAATVLPWPSGFSPSYMKFSTGSWRDLIVARRSRKSSASFDAPAMVSLRLSLRVRGQLTSLLWGNRARSPAGPKGRFAPFIPFFWRSGPSPRASRRQRACWRTCRSRRQSKGWWPRAKATFRPSTT